MCICGQVLTKHKIQVFKTTLHAGFSPSPPYAALGVRQMLTLDLLHPYSSLSHGSGWVAALCMQAIACRA